MSKLGDLIPEVAKRNYKDEYKKFQSSTKSKKYRAELNKYNRKKGTYGNGDGKDASHKNGKIVGFESQSKNRGRAEKSRLKKEAASVNEAAYIDMNALLVEGFDTNAMELVEKFRSDERNFQHPIFDGVARTLTEIRDLFGADEI